MNPLGARRMIIESYQGYESISSRARDLTPGGSQMVEALAGGGGLAAGGRMRGMGFRGN